MSPLLTQNKGKIDPTLAEAFLADHYDTFTKKTGANLRTLCGHGESSMEGEPGWDVKPYDPSGAVLGKVIDTRMAEAMTFIARIGHPSGRGVSTQRSFSTPTRIFHGNPRCWKIWTRVPGRNSGLANTRCIQFRTDVPVMGKRSFLQKNARHGGFAAAIWTT